MKPSAAAGLLTCGQCEKMRVRWKPGAEQLGTSIRRRGPLRQQPDSLGPMPVWNLGDLYPSPASAEVDSRPEKGRRRGQGHSGVVSGQARRAGEGRHAACGGHWALRGAERYAGQARLLRGAALCCGYVQSRKREILRRHPGAAHRHHDGSDLLRAGDQQDRRRGAGACAGGAGTGPVQTLVRRPAQGEALPARGEARAPVP